MGMTRESKLKNVFATPLPNNIFNKVTELKVSELSFKHKFNEKEPIVGDNKGIFTHLKAVKCDNCCSSRGNSSISRMPGCGPNALPKNWI